jgi:hypothetical protein
VAAVQAYLRRRDALAADVRAAMAKKIAISLIQRLDIAQLMDMSYDAFLQWLDQEVRSNQAFR